MENSPRVLETHCPSLIPSPINYGSTTTGNGIHLLSPRTPNPSSIPITRSEPNNPYPTTFVQADTSTFKQVVQSLTGSAETARHASRSDTGRNPIPLIKTGPSKEKSSSRLYERRNSIKNFKIRPLGAGFSAGCLGSPGSGTQEILSPSILDFPSLALSPVTPLIPDPFNRGVIGNSCVSNLDAEAEEKAIKEKGFYLHPSPASTPRDSEPRLLPLFPVTSPRVVGSSNSTDS